MTEPVIEAVPDLREVAAAPTLLGLVRRIGWRGFFDAVVPITLFAVLNTTVGIAWAIGASTVWALGMGVYRLSRRGQSSVFIWVGLVYVLVRGIAGLTTHSKIVFFGPGVVQGGLIGVVFFVSLIFRRPAVGYIAPIVYPFEDFVRRHDAYRRAFTRLTWMWAIYLVAKALLDIWLLNNLSASAFVIVRSVIAWPMLVGLFVISLRYPRRVFRRVPELLPYVEAAEGRPPAQVAALADS